MADATHAAKATILSHKVNASFFLWVQNNSCESCQAHPASLQQAAQARPIEPIAIELGSRPVELQQLILNN
eukprot:12346883-Karenia_brevis.AAC.1